MTLIQEIECERITQKIVRIIKNFILIDKLFFFNQKHRFAVHGFSKNRAFDADS